MPGSAKPPGSTGSPSLVFKGNRVKRVHFPCDIKHRPVSLTVPGTYQALDFSTSARRLSCHLLVGSHSLRPTHCGCGSFPLPLVSPQMSAHIILEEQLEESPVLFTSAHLCSKQSKAQLWPAGAWQRLGKPRQHLPFTTVEKWPIWSQVPTLAVLLQGLIFFSSHVCPSRPQVSSPTPNVSHKRR